jgi:hypothetical protein
MSKEEGRRLSEEIATKNAKKTTRTLQADGFESIKSVILFLFVLCFLQLFVAITLLPSTFLVRHSSVSEAIGGGFAALGPSCLRAFVSVVLNYPPNIATRTPRTG